MKLHVIFNDDYFIMSKQPIASPSANVTNPSLKQLNESYASKIAKGQIDITKQQSKTRLNASEHYDRLMKAKKITEAEKEKKELERKLQYLNKSIQSIKEYDYSTGRVSTSAQHHNIKTPQKISPPKDMEELRKKVKEYQAELNRKREADREKKAKQAEEKKRAMEKKEQEKKAERRQHIFESMQKIKKRIQDRQSSSKKQEEQYRRVVLHKSLHQKLQQSFSQKQASILQQRKKKLADIRNLHRPISLAQISDHQKTFMQLLKQKQSMRERERRINNAGEDYHVSYKSPMYMKVVSGEKEIKEDQSRIKADKMRQFSQHVRENFVPIVDERKRQSLEKAIEEERERKERQKIDRKKEEDAQRVQQIRSKGLRYLQQIKDLPKRKNPSTQSPPATQRIHYKNYLTHSQRGSGGNWRNILTGSNMDKKQKAIRLQAQAERLQGGLKMREKKARLLKEDPGEIDQEYFDMIKAKLDLFDI